MMLEIKLPEQYTGGQTDNSETISIESSDLAKQKYKKIKNKLLDINNWHIIAEGLSGIFILTDDQGKDKKGLPKVDDFIKIKIPIPGPISGEGFDWVKIENIQESFDSNEDNEYLFFTLRPGTNPHDESEVTAHFYTNESTNSFSLVREKEKITVSINGRNEVPNKSQSEGIDKIRNQGIAIGAIFGMADPQWKNLIVGLFKD